MTFMCPEKKAFQIKEVGYYKLKTGNMLIYFVRCYLKAQKQQWKAFYPSFLLSEGKYVANNWCVRVSYVYFCSLKLKAAIDEIVFLLHATQDKSF